MIRCQKRLPRHHRHRRIRLHFGPLFLTPAMFHERKRRVRYHRGSRRAMTTLDFYRPRRPTGVGWEEERNVMRAALVELRSKLPPP